MTSGPSAATCARGTTRAAPSAEDIATSLATNAGRAQFSRQLKDILLNHGLDAWWPRVRDGDAGGFHCDFDATWQPVSTETGAKSLEFQARTTWVFARAAQRFPGRGYDGAVRQGIAFLTEAMWDPTYGGFFTVVDRAGEPLEDGRKHVHGNVYAVNAIRAAVPMIGAAEAGVWRDRALGWLDEVAWDGRYGGHCGYFARDGRRLQVGDLEVPYDWLGTPVGLKDLNSIVDAIKMLADLVAAGHGGAARDRLDWYVRLVTERLIGITGLMPDYYAPDWTPVPDVIRAGQGFQFVAVLLQTFDVLGRADEGRDIAARLARTYSDQFAHAGGGFVFARSLVRYPIRGFDMAVPERPWWVQIEACHGFLDLARRGIDREEFVGRFATAWSQIESTLLDPVHGGFYESVEQGIDARGTGSGAAPGMKAGIWKDPSHEVNFLLDALDWLEEWNE